MELAGILGVHQNTLHCFMQENSITHKFSNTSMASLDMLARKFKEQKSDSGFQYFAGFVESHGLYIQCR
ncbi:hypothetical protein SERLA73DRAFT_49090 [Serpula lacrymans var. lacrymans S7.3]|uniref:Uncharacterized protein n=1 Tax=Serpula lacrymans var. lacrymans (strain S7.3) TaxID=936435 RepID=F8PQ64_SERL3|nr:hypothetical protein SERLA73DRAFT_49090 [Serpula lacrymans var. lacrymans S7.3]